MTWKIPQIERCFGKCWKRSGLTERDLQRAIGRTIRLQSLQQGRLSEASYPSALQCVAQLKAARKHSRRGGTRGLPTEETANKRQTPVRDRASPKLNCVSPGSALLWSRLWSVRAEIGKNVFDKAFLIDCSNVSWMATSQDRSYFSPWHSWEYFRRL